MDVLGLLKLLADDNRLRLLTLLEQEELSVQDLTRITDLGQSRVSHHLGILRQAAVIEDRREGSFTLCRLRPGEGENPLSPEMWAPIATPFRASETAERDRARLAELLEERRRARRAAHDRLAGVWGGVGEDLERGSLRYEALAALAEPTGTVADLGCGAGFFTRLLVQRFEKVIAVDHSEAMLREARRALPADAPIEWRAGSLEALPIETGEVDAVFANLVIHHVVELDRATAEISRILRPGGRVVITDLAPHHEEWMRDELATERLGIAAEEVCASLERAGIGPVQKLAVEDRYQMKSSRGRVARLGLFLVRGSRQSAR